MNSFDKKMLAFAVALGTGLVGLLGYAIWLEVAHPCTKQGECHWETTYVKSGEILVPITNKVCECLERAP